MYLRSMLTQLPRITHNSVVRSCSHKINSQPTESPSDWQTIYNFPSIKFLAQLSKLKIYQSIVTVAGIPLLIGLESYQYVPAQTTELFAMLGITGTISLSVYSLCSTKVIGFVYVNPVLKQIRLSYIDFWGRRQNQDLTLKELVSSDQKRLLNTYTVVKTTTPAGSLKLLSYGNVIDPGVFHSIFGDL